VNPEFKRDPKETVQDRVIGGPSSGAEREHAGDWLARVSPGRRSSARRTSRSRCDHRQGGRYQREERRTKPSTQAQCCRRNPVSFENSAAVGGLPTLIPRWLPRVGCAAALTAAGFPTSPKTLATKASRGGGPPFRRWGAKPLYPWGMSLARARDRLGPPIGSTSEADAPPHDRPAAAEPARRRQEAEPQEPGLAR
jgi:hypothetical protein